MALVLVATGQYQLTVDEIVKSKISLCSPDGVKCVNKSAFVKGLSVIINGFINKSAADAS